jgi:hypothetical protein
MKCFWKIVTISYLSILSMLGIMTLYMAIVFVIAKHSTYEFDSGAAIGIYFMFSMQFIGLILSGITTLTSYASYSDYAKFTFIPLSIWCLSFITMFFI